MTMIPYKRKDYWKPKYKYQVREWLEKRYPGKSWSWQNKEHLFAIYHRIQMGVSDINKE